MGICRQSFEKTIKMTNVKGVKLTELDKLVKLPNLSDHIDSVKSGCVKLLVILRILHSISFISVHV